jgi:hypothetical protein
MPAATQPLSCLNQPKPIPAALRRDVREGRDPQLIGLLGLESPNTRRGELRQAVGESRAVSLQTGAFCNPEVVQAGSHSTFNMARQLST